MEIFFLVVVLIFSGMWIFSSTREHLLSSLLSLEYMVVGIFFYFFWASYLEFIFMVFFI